MLLNTKMNVFDKQTTGLLDLNKVISATHVGATQFEVIHDYTINLSHFHNDNPLTD